MKIAILLPYKENYSMKYSGAVSIHVKNLLKHSKFKKDIKIYGSTEYRDYLSKNYINLDIKRKILQSSNKRYLNRFLDYYEKSKWNIVEIHNRPNYVNKISENTSSKIILYFHNNPINLSGSKSINERLKLLKKCVLILFNSHWTKKNFFKGIDENLYKEKVDIVYQSTKKSKVNFSKKQNLITFIGKLNTSKGYDIFGKAIIKILEKYPSWKSIVIGDEPREKLFFNHKNLKIYSFKENKFVLNVLKKTSISVACSRWEEPFGRSSLEANSLGCLTIITNRGGLPETTKNPIILKKLDHVSLISLIEKYILNKSLRIKIQKLNYKNFYLTNEFVSKQTDKIRSKLIEIKKIINIKKNIKPKIIHITNFNIRHFGRLQFNTSVRINNGLIRNGCNVLSISDRDLINLKKSLIDTSGEKYLNNLIENTVNNFKPDLIILGHADKVNNQMLQSIRDEHNHLKISQWFLDPLNKDGPDYKKNKERILDKIDVVDSTFITTDPKSIKFKTDNTFFIPNPCDKSLDNLKIYNYKPENDLFYAISHGVHRGVLRQGKKDDREIFISKLLNKCHGIKFDLYGMFNKQPIWGNEFLKKISNSKMGLNLSRGKPIKYYSSDRIAQLMGNGLLTLIDKQTFYGDFFNNNEMVFYENLDDLSEKINKYSKDDKLRRKIAKNGHNKYHKFFNSEILARFIIERSLGINTKNKFLWEK